MKGDFTRQTFRADRHYSAVLYQQGRVQLDADANEQAAIRLALARRTAEDLIGPHGGPGTGFEVRYVPREQHKNPANLTITPGRYYVNGVLVDSTRPPAEHAVGAPAPATAARDVGGTGGRGTGPGGAEPPAGGDAWTYWDQPFAYLDQERDGDHLPDEFPFLVCLAVSERLVTVVEDPSIGEPALGAPSPDTAARAQVVWQVLPLRLDATEDPEKAFDAWVAGRAAARGRLAARTERPERVEDDPCVLSPDAAYRGPENQLYRVEIHRGGGAGVATFKWSRDNGSVIFPIVSLDGAWVTVGSLGRDEKLGLRPGDLVEVVDDAHAARREAAALPRVEETDPATRRARLSEAPPPGPGHRLDLHPLLRRWDHRGVPAAPVSPDIVSTGTSSGGRLDGGAVKIVEGRWLDLEDGVQVWFEPGGEYATGDYWQIPARCLTAGVEWPRDAAGRPVLSPPHGVPRHYAPLAWVRGATDVRSLRRTFRPLAVPPSA